MEKIEERVVVTRPMIGLLYMQVCAVDDATDEEILEVCNRNNPAGTMNGWGIVIRNDKEYPNLNPVACQDIKGRTHFLVAC